MRKVRVYQCKCGGQCVRPLNEDFPNPCERCESDLLIQDYTIEDHGVFVRTIIEEARKKREDQKNG
jgi:hypothetical protein